MTYAQLITSPSINFSSTLVGIFLSSNRLIYLCKEIYLEKKDKGYSLKEDISDQKRTCKL
jgi:hypothetical protein